MPIMKNKIVIATGGFDPIHAGHIAYLDAAAELGDMLLVGVNSNDWLVRKKDRAFMDFRGRCTIIGKLAMVDGFIIFDDSDNSANDAINMVKQKYPDAEIIFANGGDRTKDNTPEQEMYGNDPQVTFVFGVGGDKKIDSSSWILDEWKAPKTIRPWGYYRVLHEDDGVTVKELTVEPGKSLSMQRHAHRSELWLVGDGQCKVKNNLNDNELVLNKHESTHIAVNEWHQLFNPFSKPCKLIEIQYGTFCIEDDIERKQD